MGCGEGGRRVMVCRIPAKGDSRITPTGTWVSVVWPANLADEGKLEVKFRELELFER